jgi:hypothetical protein
MGLQLKISMCISLKRVKSRVYALYALTTGNPRIRKPNALPMIGIVVSVLVTIAIHHFNYILTSVKANQKRYM